MTPLDETCLATLPTRLKLLLATLYAGYMLSMASTSSFEIALPTLVADASLGLSVADCGTTLALGQVATVVGKLSCGFVVDKRGPTKAYFECLFGMGVLMAFGVLLLMSGFNTFAVALFCAYKLTKAAVWPALAKAAKASFKPAIFGRVWGLLVTSSRVGAVAGAVALSPLLDIGWGCPALVVSVGLGSISLLLCMQQSKSPTGAKQIQHADPESISLSEGIQQYR